MQSFQTYLILRSPRKSNHRAKRSFIYPHPQPLKFQRLLLKRALYYTPFQTYLKLQSKKPSLSRRTANRFKLALPPLQRPIFQRFLLSRALLCKFSIPRSFCDEGHRTHHAASKVDYFNHPHPHHFQRTLRDRALFCYPSS